jgi:hypothetical protein
VFEFEILSYARWISWSGLVWSMVFFALLSKGYGRCPYIHYALVNELLKRQLIDLSFFTFATGFTQ